MQFFDANGVMIYESDYKYALHYIDKHEILLEEGERIIGFKSKGNSSYANHYDF